jgi:hypothetical protein
MVNAWTREGGVTLEALREDPEMMYDENNDNH